MTSVYRPTQRTRTLDRMLAEQARRATLRSGRRALAFADSQRIATANGLISQSAKAGYPNTGFLPYGDKHYPDMEKVDPNKPPLEPVGATGTQIFAGIIAEDAEYNADFYWRDKIDIYEKMRRNDGQVKAIERAIFQPIKSTEWYIRPASTSPQDKKIASFVESCLFHDMVYRTSEGRRLRQSWQQVLHHILLMLPMGFSVLAKWFMLDDEQFAKWARWEPLMQRTIWRWWVGRDTELVGIQQRSFLDYQIQFLDIPIERLLVFVHEQEGNNFDGTSILRSAYKHWYFKENFYKIEAIQIERTATLPPIATLAPEVQSPGMVQAVLKQLQNMRVAETMGITVPAGVTIEFPHNYQRGESEVSRAIEHHDAMIARSVLADFLNLGTGSSTGSYSLADVKAELFIQCEEEKAKSLENVINSDAIPELVRYNFDGVDVFPQLVHKPMQKTDLKDVAALFTANALVQDPELQDFIRNLIGAPLAPRNVVQSTNPTSPSSPPDSGTQAPMQKGHTADDTSGDGTRPEAGAPAAAMGELHDSVRLFAEAAAAIAGVDAVERGAAYAFGAGYNPYRDAHGRFAAGPHAAREGEGDGSGGGRASAAGSERASGGSRTRGGGSRSSTHSAASKGEREQQTKVTRAQKAKAVRVEREQQREDAAADKQLEAKHAAAVAKRGGSKSGKSEGEGIHERSARLQREQGLQPELNPHTAEKNSFGWPQLEHTGYREEGRDINPAAPIDSQFLVKSYGEHQFAAVLSRYPAYKINELAAREGVKAARSKDETISRITAKVTEGRYSANFPKAEAKSEKASTRHRGSGGERTRAPREKTDPFAIQTKPIARIEGRDINPSAPLDAHFVKAVYGDHQLHAALQRYPMSKLQETASNLGIRSARTKEGTIANIAAAVARASHADVLAHYQQHPNMPYHLRHLAAQQGGEA